MKILIDTNTCVYLIKNKPLEVKQRFLTFGSGEIGISALTVAELVFGVEKSQRSVQNQEALEPFLSPLIVVPFERPAALVYGRIRAHLQKAGIPIGPVDTLIAAHAIQLGVTLVTNNLKEFSRVPGLRTENWVAG